MTFRMRNSKRGTARIPRLAILLFAALLCFGTGCNRRSVVIYTSQDEEYAVPILHEFENKTGITVKAVYDSEAVKTVGLANRLLAESSNPRCDVFWNNEEMRTRMLAARNVFRETNGWMLLGYRTRRIVVNTNLLPLAKAPRLFSEATNSIWQGKVALAYPMFGTTPTHFLALRQYWGDAAWQSWCRALVANHAFLLDGNSVAARQIATGEALFGFADSDDAAAEQSDGRPVAIQPLSDESLVIHNSEAVIRNAPHPVEAQLLFEYLQNPAVQQQLVDKHALESALPGDPKTLPGLKVDWDALLRDIDQSTAEMNKIFLR